MWRSATTPDWCPVCWKWLLVKQKNTHSSSIQAKSFWEFWDVWNENRVGSVRTVRLWCVWPVKRMGKNHRITSLQHFRVYCSSIWDFGVLSLQPKNQQLTVPRHTSESRLMSWIMHLVCIFSKQYPIQKSKQVLDGYKTYVTDKTQSCIRLCFNSSDITLLSVLKFTFISSAPLCTTVVEGEVLFFECNEVISLFICCEDRQDIVWKIYRPSA